MSFTTYIHTKITCQIIKWLEANIWVVILCKASDSAKYLFDLKSINKQGNDCYA